MGGTNADADYHDGQFQFAGCAELFGLTQN